MWDAWQGERLEIEAPGRAHSNPLVLVLPTRREDPQARRRWSHFARTVREARPAAAVLVDKSAGGGARAQVRALGAPEGTRTLVWRRPAEEPYWRSLAGLRVAPGLRIQQLHDDDWWTGIPRVPPGYHRPLLAPVISSDTTFASWDVVAGLRPQHALFGAVRGDIWNSVADFAAAQPAPSGYLDVTLLLATRVHGPPGSLTGFRYEYDAGNWTPDRIDDTIAAVLEPAGWGDFLPFAAGFPITTLDNLAWLAFAWASLPRAQAARSVRLEIASSRPYGRGRLRGIAARSPRALRPVLLRARRPGNASALPGRADARAAFRARWPRTAAFLTGAEVLRAVPDVLRLLDVLIAEGAGNAEQAAWWRSHVARLEVPAR